MADRLASLRRIEAVQKQLVRLSTWRIEKAEQECRRLDADRERLRSYIAGGEALGAPLAKAALKAADTIDTRRAGAERGLQAERALLATRKARDHVVAAMAESAAVVARRAEDDRTLSMTIDAWLATPDASLP